MASPGVKHVKINYFDSSSEKWVPVMFWEKAQQGDVPPFISIQESVQSNS